MRRSITQVGGKLVEGNIKSFAGRLQKTMGHASITVTAHIDADLYDDSLDDVASALDALDDRQLDQR